MANHKSAIKRARQNELRRLRNKSVRTRVKSIVKDVRSAASEKTDADMSAKISVVQSVIDKASKKRRNSQTYGRT